VWGLSFNFDGSRLVSCSDDCKLIVWQLFAGEATEASKGRAEEHGKYRSVCTLAGHHDRTVFSVDWSGDGPLASAGADNTINVFQQAPGGGAAAEGAFSLDKACAQPMAHLGDVNCVRWNPKDSAVLASAADDGVVKLWKFTDPDM
jgi:WD40 repeat protein